MKAYEVKKDITGQATRMMITDHQCCLFQCYRYIRVSLRKEL